MDPKYIRTKPRNTYVDVITGSVSRFNNPRSPICTLDPIAGEKGPRMPLEVKEQFSSIKDVMHKYKQFSLENTPTQDERIHPGNRRAAPVVPYVNQYNLPKKQPARRFNASVEPKLENTSFDKIGNQEYRAPLVQQYSYERGRNKFIRGDINAIV